VSPWGQAEDTGQWKTMNEIFAELSAHPIQSCNLLNQRRGLGPRSAGRHRGHRCPQRGLLGYDSAERCGSELAPRQCALMAARFFSDSDSESSDSIEYLHSSVMCNEHSQLNIRDLSLAKQ